MAATGRVAMNGAPRTGRRLFADLLRAEPRLLLSAAALATLAAVAELAPYVLVHRMAGAVMAPDPDPGHLVWLAVLMLVAAILRLLLFGGANILSHRMAFRIQKNLQVALVRALERQPLGALEGRAGDLKKTLVDDVGGLEHLIAHTLPDAVAGLVLPLLAAVLLLVVDWRMALASLALLPVALVAQKRAFSGLEVIHAQWHAADTAANASLLAYIRGIATLKAHHRVARSLGTLRQAVHALAGLADSITRRTAIPYALFFVMLSTNLLVVLPVGLVLHVAGSLDVAAFVLFVVLGAGLTAPLLRVMYAFGALERQMQGAARVAALLDTPAVSPGRQPPIAGTRVGADISFEHVSFGYGERPDVVHDVSFTIPAGSIAALVGPSGAGKSTLVRLVARFWDPRAGAVHIGGVDVRAMAPECLRDQVAVVFQDPFFFNGTLRENLVIATADTTTATLMQAVDAVGLSGLVAQLPQGLDTPIGDRGARLSGGERQRLAIARALLKDAPILLLDEATAFADPESERAVQRAIGRLTVGRTVLVVAHRLATVMQADTIAVLADGRLDGVGRHEILLRDSPVYRRLWDAQTGSRDWALRT
ncbi:ABC transporter ATP-binding protein [Reyranella sp. CPCC 100927]|uniref:ABC transporter ATP-binding protein n=1 Tax=Reyranella sp. CPCC 100927 TaxID=2599616 RepID=UPI0011B7EF53|nr:ABC transporter ATP-binding protein [Reyranella sp. CPCC 100927]TWT15274.1 ABC transporter ATP-binding protein [Reyranella sp. CPCC 100927]